ncbi:hypothetical protein BC830DRAFT_1214054 [Chytriomyces sp. MP71]|nr:hypothetical protein BC830DRAFT_1214054 [Chytriomyces sp. MP71]
MSSERGSIASTTNSLPPTALYHPTFSKRSINEVNKQDSQPHETSTPERVPAPRPPTLPPPNTFGKLLASHPNPVPDRFLTQSTAAPETDYIALSPTARTDDAAYPRLPPCSSSLVDERGRLKPAAQREAVFEELEGRVAVLKRQCGDIVKSARSLQKACATSAAGLSGASNSNGVNGVSSNGSKSDQVVAGNANKKRALGGDDTTETKLRLKQELNNLVQFSRQMRNSIVEDIKKASVIWKDTNTRDDE